MSDKIQLNIIGLTTGHAQKNSYTLILGEIDGDLKLPVVIGSYEAQSIALVIEKIKPHRPLTHDLIFNMLESFQVEMTEVIIYKLQEGVFYAKLICVRDGQEIEIDSRTSDAIALALRCECPIYTYRNIMDDAGIIIDAGDESEEAHQQQESRSKSDGPGIKKLSLEELEKELDKAIQVEDYDRAAMIRDEIKSRQ